MSQELLEEAIRVKAHADCLYDEGQVAQAVARMAGQITSDLADKDPIVLAVMNGGLIPAGLLLPRLQFPLRVDYLHATRYREGTTGHELVWQRSE